MMIAPPFSITKKSTLIIYQLILYQLISLNHYTFCKTLFAKSYKWSVCPAFYLFRFLLTVKQGPFSPELTAIFVAFTLWVFLSYQARSVCVRYYLYTKYTFIFGSVFLTGYTFVSVAD